MILEVKYSFLNVVVSIKLNCSLVLIDLFHA